MKPLIQELVGKGPVLLDGAWGTEFFSQGLEPGACPDFWNLEHPGRVEHLARAYVEAGSRVILTNTFRSNRIALALHGVAGKVRELNHAGVEISRRAAGSRAWVFASLGPSGKMLVAGEVSAEELRAAFLEQAEALANAGADGLVFETMSDLEEARLAVEAARTTGLPVVVCMAFDSGKAKDRTMTGTTPEQAAAELSVAGADVIGANCGRGIEAYAELCRRFVAASDLPVWLKPNAGLPKLVGDRVMYLTTPEEFAASALALVQAGAAFLGGCCGTGPDFIRAVARALGVSH